MFYWRLFSGIHSLVVPQVFILARSQVAKFRMPPFPVVEALNVLKYSQPGFLSGGKLVVVYHFCFHRLKEALGYCVVPAIALTAHTLQHRFPLQLLTEGTASILHTPVRVKQKGVEQWPVFNGHLKGSHRSCDRLHGLTQCPTDYFPVSQIQYHRQVQPAFPGPDVS